MTRKECFSITELEQRGWTRSMIDRMLGKPDLEWFHPNKIKLYEIARVQQVEATASFKTTIEEHNKLRKLKVAIANSSTT